MESRVQRRRLRIKKRRRFTIFVIIMLAVIGTIFFLIGRSLALLYANNRSVDKRNSNFPIVDISNEQKKSNNKQNKPDKDSDPNSADDIDVSKDEASIGNKTELLFSFAGDCTLGWDNKNNTKYHAEYNFDEEFKRQNNDYGYFFKHVKPIFEKSDASIVNLETPLTNAQKRSNKRFVFKGRPEYANILKHGGIHMVNLSNNHTNDYGEKGMSDTTAALDKSSILYFYEGNIIYKTYNGINVAFAAYKGWNIDKKNVIEKELKQAAEKADIIIVSFHWGDEGRYIPNSTQIKLARFAIDNGASLVVGHHPHVIQGIEKYKDRYIVYSLGNFCFGGNLNPRDKDTFIFQNRFIIDRQTKNIIDSKPGIIPCSISSVPTKNNYQPIPLSSDEADRVLHKIYEYSKPLEYGIKPGL